MTDTHDEQTWARFTRHVLQRAPEDCWLWTGARDKDHYGVFKLDGKAEKAHRVSFLLAHGRWPEPEVCHQCEEFGKPDNPACVNPHHLAEGDRSRNMQERADRGRQAGGRVPTGFAEWEAPMEADT